MPNAGSSSNQRIGVIAETYARALFSLAEKTGSVPTIEQELNDLAELVDQNASLAALFEHRTIDRAKRAESIRAIFKDAASPNTLNFLLVLNDRNRLDQLQRISQAFTNLAKQSRGEVDADIYTARPLNNEQLNAVSEKLTAAIGKTAIVHPHTDPSLIGGIRVRIGDKLLDASVATQLAKLSQKLTQRGHQIAKSGAAAILEAD